MRVPSHGLPEVEASKITTLLRDCRIVKAQDLTKIEQPCTPQPASIARALTVPGTHLPMDTL